MILTTPSGTDFAAYDWHTPRSVDADIPTAGVPDSDEVQRYMDDTWQPGQRIPRRIKYRIMLDRIELYDERIADLAGLLSRGEITLGEWEERMAQEIKGLHLNSYVTGQSGRWENLTDRDYTAIGDEVARQQKYLRRWRNQLAGQQASGDIDAGQVVTRARLYGQAASGSFEKGHGAENGLPPDVLPAHPGDGTTECLTGCKCRWTIRLISRERGDADANWTLGPSEHCETCLKRARSWLGLRIRGGELKTDVEPIFYER